MEKEREMVVLFPFMARGHIIPFLALAQHIHHQMRYHITFVTTPLNITKIDQTLLPPAIKLLEIPFNSADHGLPPNSEDSDSLPYNLSLRLLQVSSAALRSPFHNLLSALIEQNGGAKPVSVISDVFFGWAADVAHQLGIFHAIFSATGGFGLACYCSMWLNMPHHTTEGAEFQLPDFPEAGSFHATQVAPAVLAAREADDPFTDFQRRNLEEWSNSDAFLFNTVEDLDDAGLNYFHRKLSIPVWGIGPLLLPDQSRGATADKFMEWLDKKEANSVMYICFGSQGTISASQMMNLAKALDAGGASFIWVVRPPLGFDINAEFVAEHWLPEEFLQRIHDEDRGLIISKWAPQVEILAHKAVAVFMSHCGWNSVLESLTHGVPLIGWPMGADQFYNAKLLVEKVGVCVEVARGTNFEVRHEDIAQKIELVMGENRKGREIRRRSLEIKEMLRDAIRDEDNYRGSSVKAMQEFFKSALLETDGTSVS